MSSTLITTQAGSSAAGLAGRHRRLTRRPQGGRAGPGPAAGQPGTAVAAVRDRLRQPRQGRVRRGQAGLGPRELPLRLHEGGGAERRRRRLSFSSACSSADARTASRTPRRADRARRSSGRRRRRRRRRCARAARSSPSSASSSCSRAARRASRSTRKWSRIAISYASPPRSNCSSANSRASCWRRSSSSVGTERAPAARRQGARLVRDVAAARAHQPISVASPPAPGASSSGGGGVPSDSTVGGRLARLLLRLLGRLRLLLLLELRLGLLHRRRFRRGLLATSTTFASGKLALTASSVLSASRLGGADARVDDVLAGIEAGELVGVQRADVNRALAGRVGFGGGDRPPASSRPWAASAAAPSSPPGRQASRA